MNITFYNEQSALDIPFTLVQGLAQTVFKTLGLRYPDEIIVHLVNKEVITQLHADFFDDPTPTDCISFPLDDLEEIGSGYTVLGEIFVCPEVALEYAASHDKDPLEETALYMIHGLLHLLGYDDIEEMDREEMRSIEKLLLFHCRKENVLYRK